MGRTVFKPASKLLTRYMIPEHIYFKSDTLFQGVSRASSLHQESTIDAIEEAERPDVCVKSFYIYQHSLTQLNLSRMTSLLHSAGRVEFLDCRYAFETCYLSHHSLYLLHIWPSIQMHQLNRNLVANDRMVGTRLAKE